MNKKEQRPPTLDEQLKPLERQTLKRARRLLNPLDDHPFLLINYVEKEPHTLFPGNPSGSGMRYTAQTAILDADMAREREKKEPGTAAKEAEIKAQNGLELLHSILSESVDDDIKEIHTFSEFTNRSFLNSHAEDARVRLSLNIIRYAIDASTHTGDDDKPLYTEIEQLDLFAAVVGFAQAHIIDQLGYKDQKRRKYVIRDQVLIYGMTVLRLYDRENLDEYLTTQKAYQGGMQS